MEKLVQEYFNNSAKNMEKKINLNKKHILNFVNDANEDPVVDIYEINDNNKKLVMRAKYYMIGMYINKTWYWGYSIPLINKKITDQTKIVKNIKNDILKNYEKYELSDVDYYYYVSKNPIFHSDDANKLPELMVYLNKSLWYMPVFYNDKNKIIYDNDNSFKFKVEYYAIESIIQQYHH